MMLDLQPARKNKGQSMLEAIFALAIILLVVLALVQIVTGAIRSSDFAQKSSQATAYCQEAMEKVRSYRDQNWTTFTTSCDTLIGNSRLTAFRLTANPTADFTLAFTGCETIGNQRKVTLRVSWTDSTGTHWSELVSFFSNWK